MPDIVPHLEVCFSPALLKAYSAKGKTVVLVDILRATSAICAAFANGVKAVIPVSSEAEAQELKQQGFLLAGEKDGVKLPFADFGNSPFNFMSDLLRDREIAYCTTNGTKAVHQAADASVLLIGSYLNFSVLSDYLEKNNQTEILILCSGWKNKFSLEDALFAGALSSRLLSSGKFSSVCDSATAAMDLWEIARHNLMQYVEKCAHRHRLKNLSLDDVLQYCHTFDAAPCLPVYINRKFTDLNTHNL